MTEGAEDVGVVEFRYEDDRVTLVGEPPAKFWVSDDFIELADPSFLTVEGDEVYILSVPPLRMRLLDIPHPSFPRTSMAEVIR